MPEAELSADERNARKRVRGIRAFHVHAVRYGAVIAGLAVVNLVTGPDHLWFLWAAFGWGVALVVHGLNAFGIVSLFGDGWTERQVSKRLKRTRRDRDGDS